MRRDIGGGYVSQVTGTSAHALADPPIWFWLLGLFTWLLIVGVIAGSSGSGAFPALVVTILGVLLGTAWWGPRHTKFAGHALTPRTLWRSRSLDLRTVVEVTGSGMTAWSSGELGVRFKDGAMWDMTMRGPGNIRFARELLRTLENLGKSDVIDESARRFM